MEFTSLVEKKIHDDVEKMFGDKDPELKMITKLAMLKEIYNDDDDMNNKIQDFINKVKYNAVKESKLITDELKCCLDSSGNVIVLKKSQHSLNE